MKVTIIPIGNSRGIRIPKVMLEHCHIDRSVELEAKGDTIILKPFKEKARKNWEQAFKKMHENRDDQLIIDDSIDLNIENGEWL